MKALIHETTSEDTRWEQNFMKRLLKYQFNEEPSEYELIEKKEEDKTVLILYK